MTLKYDSGKEEYGLIPPNALHEMVKVLTFGAQKYARGNWRTVEDGPRRYYDALQRHLWAWKRGEELDSESGLPHLAHAMCCLFFLYELDSVDPILDKVVEKLTQPDEVCLDRARGKLGWAQAIPAEFDWARAMDNCGYTQTVRNNV